VNLKPKVNSPLLKILAAIAACGLATSAYSLTIVPTFDNSILTNDNVVGITNAINGAIQVLQSNLLDNVTVNITFTSDETVGLGQSVTFGDDVNYGDFITALKSHAASSRDAIAYSLLPNSAVDPVIGGTQIHVTTALARLLGLDNSYTGPDSTVQCKMSLMNFTRPPSDPGKYDLQQVLEHEMDEVLGISSALPTLTKINPADLFRYTTNLVRTYTTSGDNAYFSTDGTNLLARYNMDPGGDYGDWWSVSENWSPLLGEMPNFPQVQDAFSGPGNALDLGAAELAILDVVGWTLPTPPPGPVTLTIVSSGPGQFTLSWTNTASGFVLQERDALASGNWTVSSTGSTNPAVLLSSTSQKFYRLYEPIPLGQQTATHLASNPIAHGPYTVTIRKLEPRQF
jgi:hypothetical protein